MVTKFYGSKEKDEYGDPVRTHRTDAALSEKQKIGIRRGKKRAWNEGIDTGIRIGYARACQKHGIKK